MIHRILCFSNLNNVSLIGIIAQRCDCNSDPPQQELGAKQVWGFVKEIPELLKYFLEFVENHLPDRSFLWSILGTLRTKEYRQLLEDARKARSENSKENKEELIEIDPDYLNQIVSAPTKSHSILKNYFSYYLDKGRVTFLLKSSKQAMKPKKVHKKHEINFRKLKKNELEEEKKEEEYNQNHHNQDDETEINVDARPEDRAIIIRIGSSMHQPNRWSHTCR